MSGRIQNLKPWPKGVSGNLAGRPKGDVSAEIARAVFENNPAAIYEGMVRRLKKGDPRAFKVLAERAYGKVKEQVDLDASVAVVERLQAGRRRVLEGLSVEELEERIRQLARELGYVPAIEGAEKPQSLLAEAGDTGGESAPFK